MQSNDTFSFVGRDVSLIDVAEKLCSVPSKCLTTLFVNDPSEVVLRMKHPRFSRHTVNIMMIPTKNFDRTVVISVYCPYFKIQGC